MTIHTLDQRGGSDSNEFLMQKSVWGVIRHYYSITVNTPCVKIPIQNESKFGVGAKGICDLR